MHKRNKFLKICKFQPFPECLCIILIFIFLISSTIICTVDTAVTRNKIDFLYRDSGFEESCC